MDFLLNQGEFVRSLTLKAVDGIDDSLLDRIPEGFRNHIRWQLGHIFVAQERLVIGAAGLPMQLPEHYGRLFPNGSTPLDWQPDESPPIAELTALLREQPGRIRSSITDRLHEPVPKPYTTSSGLTLSTIGEFVSFTLYHEGMHVSMIKLYKKLLDLR